MVLQVLLATGIYGTAPYINLRGDLEYHTGRLGQARQVHLPPVQQAGKEDSTTGERGGRRGAARIKVKSVI
jgi:hypothetical protein